MSQWQPSATIDTLKRRAEFIAKIRQFFAERRVMEVETPLLSQACVSDVHLASFKTQLFGPAAPQGKDLYLPTSPEFHMKRLLCAGSGCIYSLNKAFRNEEAGRFHNPEFTMLEWYRLGFDHFQLMKEMEALLALLLGTAQVDYLSYQQAFQELLGIDPLEASEAELLAAAEPLGVAELVEQEPDRDTVLQLLFSLGVEPKIGQSKPCFVYDFPASQAALARISPKDLRVAERFELYFKGVELANGFHELSDVKEQRQRFEHDQAQRRQRGQAEAKLDQNFLAALEAGLPDCAGVALGVDRLFMLAEGAEHIQEVLSFSIQRA